MLARGFLPFAFLLASSHCLADDLSSEFGGATHLRLAINKDLGGYDVHLYSYSEEDIQEMLAKHDARARFQDQIARLEGQLAEFLSEIQVLDGKAKAEVGTLREQIRTLRGKTPPGANLPYKLLQAKSDRLVLSEVADPTKLRIIPLRVITSISRTAQEPPADARLPATDALQQ